MRSSPMSIETTETSLEALIDKAIELGAATQLKSIIDAISNYMQNNTTIDGQIVQSSPNEWVGILKAIEIIESLK
jgi:anionic cell wall polymer biosynthesis LytR-Cps2A-Psr (LCP) family protein